MMRDMRVYVQDMIEGVEVIAEYILNHWSKYEKGLAGYKIDLPALKSEISRIWEDIS